MEDVGDAEDLGGLQNGPRIKGEAFGVVGPISARSAVGAALAIEISGGIDEPDGDTAVWHLALQKGDFGSCSGKGNPAARYGSGKPCHGLWIGGQDQPHILLKYVQRGWKAAAHVAESAGLDERMGFTGNKEDLHAMY